MFTARTKLSILKALLTRRSPIYVQFALTKHCNFRCGMCSSTQSREKERELSVPEIDRLAGVLYRLGTGVLVITGGEPFMRRDLPDVIRCFTKRGLTVRLQTNGVLAAEDRIRECMAAGLKEVTISLESLTPGIQDTVNNRAGSWKEIMASIGRFSNILPRKGVILGLNTMVSRLNIDEIPRIIEFATRIGFYCSLIPVHGAGGEGDFIIRKEAPDFTFRPEDHPRIDALYNTVLDLKKKGRLVYNSDRFLKESPDFLKFGKTRWSCLSPDLYFAVSPGGNFLPCVDIGTSISMLDGDFVTTFRSPEFRAGIRGLVSRCPGCLYACWAEITYLCTDIGVLAERAVEGIRIAMRSRPVFDEQKEMRWIESGS